MTSEREKEFRGFLAKINAQRNVTQSRAESDVVDLLKQVEEIFGADVDTIVLYQTSLWHTLRMLDPKTTYAYSIDPKWYPIVKEYNAELQGAIRLYYEMVAGDSYENDRSLELQFASAKKFAEEHGRSEIEKSEIWLKKLLNDAGDDDEFSIDDVNEMCDLAYAYEFGINVERDQQKADEWRIAAIAHDGVRGLAEESIGINYSTTNEDCLGIAAHYYRKAMAKGSVYAACLLGTLYSAYNIDNDNDFGQRKAFECFEIAANGGVEEAQYKLACMYEAGECVDQDLSKAADLFMKAMERGSLDAKYRFARLLEHGIGITKDEDSALALYKELNDALSRGEELEDESSDDVVQALSAMYRDGRGASKG